MDLLEPGTLRHSRTPDAENGEWGERGHSSPWERCLEQFVGKLLRWSGPSVKQSQVDAGDEGIGLPGVSRRNVEWRGNWGREAAVLQSGHRTTLRG